MNFQKVVDQESDPKALRHFKHIIETRPITVITKDDTEKGELTADYPLVVSMPTLPRSSKVEEPKEISEGIVGQTLECG